MDSEVHDDEPTVSAEAALNEIFGYSNQLADRHREGRI